MEASLSSLLKQKEQELAALRERSLSELQKQVADQEVQLTALRANFAFNLRLLDARDAELAAYDAQRPAQEAKAISLKRAVISLRTALARAEAESKKEKEHMEKTHGQWLQEQERLQSAANSAEKQCRRLQEALHKGGLNHTYAHQEQLQQARDEAARRHDELQRHHNKRLSMLQAEWGARLAKAAAAVKAWEVEAARLQRMERGSAERAAEAVQRAEEREAHAQELQRQLSLMSRRATELSHRLEQLHGQQHSSQLHASEAASQLEVLQHQQDLLVEEKKGLTYDLKAALQGRSDAMQKMRQAADQHAEAQQLLSSDVMKLQARADAAEAAAARSAAEALEARRATETSRAQMRAWVERWERTWRERLATLQRQHKSALRDAARELLAREELVAELRREVRQGSTALDTCLEEVAALQEEAKAGAKREAELQHRLKTVDAEVVVESSDVQRRSAEEPKVTTAALTESQARCAAQEEELERLRRQLADQQAAAVQSSAEASSSELATATVPSPPTSPRSGVNFWLKGLRAPKAASGEVGSFPNDRRTAAQNSSPLVEGEPPLGNYALAAQHAAARGLVKSPVRSPAPRPQPAGETTQGASPVHKTPGPRQQSVQPAQTSPVLSTAPQVSYHVEYSNGPTPQAKLQTHLAGRPEAEDSPRAATAAQKLEESNAEIVRLRAENESLMEVGNELRAQQHRQAMLTSQAPVHVHDQPTNYAAIAQQPLAWLQQANLAPQWPAFDPRVLGAHLWPGRDVKASAPVQRSVPTGKENTFGHANLGNAAGSHNRMSPQATVLDLADGRVYQAPGQRGPANDPPVRLSDEAAMMGPERGVPQADIDFGWEGGHNGIGGSVEDGDEVSERLRRIEALTERIARAQLAAAGPQRANVRVPTQAGKRPGRSSSDQEQCVTPTAVVVQLGEGLPPSASARSTPSQKAKLRMLQQRQGQAVRQKPRNWNQPDPS